MAWTADQKAHRLPTAGPERSTQYFPAGQGGNTLTSTTVILGATAAAGGNVLPLSLTAAWKFKMNDQVETTFAHGQTKVLGLVLGDSTLEPPASGSYSAGNHPIIVTTCQNITAQPITLAAGLDLVVMQY